MFESAARSGSAFHTTVTSPSNDVKNQPKPRALPPSFASRLSAARDLLRVQFVVESDYGLFVRPVRRLAAILSCVTIILCGPRDPVDGIPAEIYYKWRSTQIDIYVLSFVLLCGFFLVNASNGPNELASVTSLGPWVGVFRILDICMAHLWVSMLHRKNGEPHPVASHNRLLVNGFINYIELAGWFALIYHRIPGILHEQGKPVHDILACLYFSSITQLTIGYGDITPVGFGRFLAALQAGLGILLLTTFIGKVLSSMRQIPEDLGE